MPSSHTRDLLNREDLWHETLRVKLLGRFETTQFANFSRCGQEQMFRTCNGCGDWKAFSYRCSIKWCPRCNWQISRERAKLIRIWSAQIKQPKHIVLTQKNFPVLTRKKLREHVKNLARIRRNKVFKHVTGGCVSVEITNEGRGWHLHSHWYVNARYVDASALSIAWGKLVNQEFGIVKVKDCRQGDYAHEVAKYVVKGSELAGWPPDQCMEFVSAVKGVRFFFTFGELTKKRSEIKKAILAQRPAQTVCSCGCSSFRFEDERRTLLMQLRKEKQSAPRKPALGKRPSESCKKNKEPEGFLAGIGPCKRSYVKD